MRLIDYIFKTVWQRRLAQYKLIRVKGWRTALIEDRMGNRTTTTFLIQIPLTNKWL